MGVNDLKYAVLIALGLSVLLPIAASNAAADPDPNQEKTNKDSKNWATNWATEFHAFEERMPHSMEDRFLEFTLNACNDADAFERTADESDNDEARIAYYVGYHLSDRGGDGTMRGIESLEKQGWDGGSLVMSLTKLQSGISVGISKTLQHMDENSLTEYCRSALKEGKFSLGMSDERGWHDLSKEASSENDE